MSRMSKQKIGVALSQEILSLEEQNRQRLGFSSRSEFIEAAIREYIGRDIFRQYTDELLRAYQSIERTEIKNMEDRLAKLSYKIAVELGQLNLMFTEFGDYSYLDAQDFRGKAVRIVNQTNGYVSLPMAAKETKHGGDYASK
jgi:Arc/MetJ-type ribon-helix-helix transcriptional regulator